MKREIIKTADGSTSIHLPEWNEQYHSKHGAIREAKHVFIETGLKKILENDQPEISILEIGFGTGLNALVTWQEVKDRKVIIHYAAVEAYPISSAEIQALNFASEINDENAGNIYKSLHNSPWESKQNITVNFQLTKQKKFFQDIEEKEEFDLIYFDAFGPRVQPELWTEIIFKKMYDSLRPGGILVTYSAKGSVRRSMQDVGFEVERLPGPPGKREMLRAGKPSLNRS